VRVCGMLASVDMLGSRGKGVIEGVTGGCDTGRRIVCSSETRGGDVGSDDDESVKGECDGICLDIPELSASRIVDSSARRGGPGDGVRNSLLAGKENI
jgi:hypothetical protein